MTDFYSILRYVWPVIVLLQLVVSIVAVSRIGGTGPILMVVGTILTTCRMVLSFTADFAGNGGLPTSYYLMQVLGILGTMVFLVGILVLVQTKYEVKEVRMDGFS